MQERLKSQAVSRISQCLLVGENISQEDHSCLHSHMLIGFYTSTGPPQKPSDLTNCAMPFCSKDEHKIKHNISQVEHSSVP